VESREEMKRSEGKGRVERRKERKGRKERRREETCYTYALLRSDSCQFDQSTAVGTHLYIIQLC
jgi:hypothetical protein